MASQHTASAGAEEHCKWSTCRFTAHCCISTLHQGWTDEKSCVDHKMERRGFLVPATVVLLYQRHKEKRSNLCQSSHNVDYE
jgi:hypothetical protein